ncbi:zinc-binding dehydrogenase [Pseudonocardia acaciae]|uniref:zinc-binding dehydrogenase n=1 Tax=Pseudonocardia acaciae TaxID=551276 RepID=UPI00049012C6|nr:alcohol dehydrogenase catalytic domain-containing protein [Pseudonocardia acaciae]
MRATVIHGPGDVRVEDVPDPALLHPTDAIVRVTLTCVCGSDLWKYRSAAPPPGGQRIGHEFIGVVEETGAEVTTVRAGDLVLAPFLWSDNTCEYCRAGWTSSCRNGGRWAVGDVDGAHGEAVRAPQADGTLVKLPADTAEEHMPALLSLSDVFPTGHHAAVRAGVGQGATVVVIGDGAVGLSAVLAAHRRGANRIVLMGRHPDRTDLGREFGATDVVAERGEPAVARVRELTGDGAPHVLECVGTVDAFETALGVARDAGTIARVGVPQYRDARLDFDVFLRNLTITGGVAPARAYIPEFLPDALAGLLPSGRVFDSTVKLEDIADGYRAMNDRTALKVLVRP